MRWPGSRASLRRDRLLNPGVDDVAVGLADRVAALRQELAEVDPALAADFLKTRELLERLRMVVDPQVEIGVVLGRVDEERGRLLAALVAAGILARFQGRNQPA